MAGMVELGSENDPRASTFSITDEDHTLGNSLRFVLNHDPRVEFCGYSVPHPSENRINIRLQTTGVPAKDLLKDGLQDLMVICQHVRATFEKAVEQHKVSKAMSEVSMKSSITDQTVSGDQAPASHYR
eukprot:c16807_g1_i1 orf=336-719(-)